MNLKKVIIIVIALIIIIVGLLTLKMSTKNEISVEKVQKIPYEYFVLYSQSNNAGVVDKVGNILIEPKYTDIFIPNASKDVFFCYNDDKCTVLNKEGKEIFSEYEEVSYLETSDVTGMVLESEVLKYKKDGSYGVLSIDGEVLTEPIYENITSLKNKSGVLLVKKDGLCGVVDTKGKEIIPTKYDNIVGDEYCLEDYGYALAGYIVSSKTDTGVMYGYIDYTGKSVLSLQYETISRVLEYDNKNDIYLVVRNKGKKGVFKNGKQIIDFNYQSINYSDMSNVFIVEKTGKYGFYTNEGKEILKPKYTKYEIAGNYISVQDDDSQMLYDLNGNLINKNAYSSMIEVENSSYFIAINDAGYYTIISKDVQIDDKYIYISYAFDDYFIFTNEENKNGVLNVWSGTVIEPEYSSIVKVEGTKLLEARNDETGEVTIYNSKLEKVCTINSAIVEKIDENYVRVYSEVESRIEYLDNDGKSVKNTEVFKDNKLYAYSQDGKWGYKDKEGKVVVEAIYDIVGAFNEYGFAGIKKDGKWGVIDESGKVIVDPSYELITYYFPQFIGEYQLELVDTLHCIELAK